MLDDTTTDAPPEIASDFLSGFTPHRPAAMESYRRLGIFADQSICHVLDAGRGADPAVTDAAGTVSYNDLRARVAARAAGLKSAGLVPGSCVVLQQCNSVRFLVNLFGLVRAGVVPVLALPAHRITEIAHLAAASTAIGYLCDDARPGVDYRDIARALAVRVPSVRHVYVDGDAAEFAAPPDGRDDDAELTVDADAPAVLLVSGGTTGAPKLIARTHNDYRYNIERAVAATGLVPSDVYLASLPAAHNFTLACPGILGMLSLGGHVVLTENPSPDNTFGLIAEHGVTATALVPALANVWAAATEWEPADVSSLRLLQVGGAKLAEPDAVKVNSAFDGALQQVFGMAEGLVCFTEPGGSFANSTQGRPMSELDEIRIVDPAGAPVASGQPGELLVRGPYTIRGYYRADAINAAAFTPDGFYRTGDEVRALQSGHLVYTGRLKETIVRAGENVSAADIEENLLLHNRIRQAAVIGLPDAALGERIVAFIVGAGAAAPDLPAVRDFLKGRGLAAFKLPDTVVAMSTLPLTAVGKVDKKALRSQRP